MVTDLQPSQDLQNTIEKPIGSSAGTTLLKGGMVHADGCSHGTGWQILILATTFELSIRIKCCPLRGFWFRGILVQGNSVRDFGVLVEYKTQPKKMLIS